MILLYCDYWYAILITFLSVTCQYATHHFFAFSNPFAHERGGRNGEEFRLRFACNGLCVDSHLVGCSSVRFAVQYNV